MDEDSHTQLRLRKWRAHGSIVEIEHTRLLRPVLSEELLVRQAVAAYVAALAADEPRSDRSGERFADTFRGDNAHLLAATEALLDIDASGALVPHGLGGHGRTLLAACAARLNRSPAGWRAMDSAPRDGTDVLLGRWYEPSSLPREWQVNRAWFDEEEGRWIMVGGQWEPHCWMPIPGAPAGGEARKDLAEVPQESCGGDR